MKHIVRSGTCALVAAMVAAGCSTSPPASEVAAANTAIGNAGQTIDRAANDPDVAKYASTELDRATDSLGMAKSAWNDKHDLQATTHFAYLAQQRAATAEHLARERAADDAVAVAAANRDHMLAIAAAQRRARPQPAPAPGQMQQGLAGFAFGGARLPRHAKPVIDELVITMKNHPGQAVVIEGHTDSVGSPAYNRALARKRAEAMRAALVRQGIESSRITIQPLGEDNPVASNDTPAGRRENRRVQVIIAEPGATMVGSTQGSTATTSSGRGGRPRQRAQ